MKRTCLLIFPLCLLLAGCGSDAVMESFESFSTELAECENAEFTSSIRAEYPDRRSDFVLKCEKSGDTCTVTVLEPESIAGIQAIVTGRSTVLNYNSISIDTGALDEHGLTPITSMPLFFEALEHGFPEGVWSENEINFWELVIDDDTSAVISFDTAKNAPVGAELISRGRVIITLDITDWSMKG